MIINIAHSEKEAREKGRFLEKLDCNGDGKNFVWLYATHEGLCVSEREMNGYHDSDFYMTVYEPDKDTFKEICFASTRGWCYPCMGSRVDASPELQEKYKAYLDRRERRYHILHKRSERHKMFMAAEKSGRSFNEIKKLYELYGTRTAPNVIKLLTANLRSKFRKSLRSQLVSWLDGKLQYQMPFSNKQIQYI